MAETAFVIPLIGTISSSGIGPATVVLGALIDSMNACALSAAAIALILLLPTLEDGKDVLLASIPLAFGVFTMYLLQGMGLIPSFLAGTMNAASIGIFATVPAGAGTFLLYAGLTGNRFQAPSPDSPGILGAAGLGTGLLLGLLATPCTGQIYLAIIGMINASGSGVGSWLPLLLLYNMVFILPFVGVSLGLAAVKRFALLEQDIVYRGTIIGAGLIGYLISFVNLRLGMRTQGLLPSDLLAFSTFLMVVLLWSGLLYRDRIA